jgi:UTP--glucose-1-phosphate uridylyltransferase
VILAIVEEALSAGIEEVAIVVQSGDRELFQEVFNTPPPIDYFNKLSRDDQRYCGELLDIGNRITFLSQDVQEGFGHAVHCAKEWVGNEPFLLLLGDHLYASDSDVPCARQLLNVYEQVGRSVVGVKVTPGADVSHFGCVTGMWEKRGSQLSVTEFYEKPDIEMARKHLRMEGLPEDAFLTVFGQYVLSPKIFDYLEEHIRHNIREHGEFQLTSCLDRLRQEDGFTAWVVQGRRFDIGIPDAYRQTVATFMNA